MVVLIDWIPLSTVPMAFCKVLVMVVSSVMISVMPALAATGTNTRNPARKRTSTRLLINRFITSALLARLHYGVLQAVARHRQGRKETSSPVADRLRSA